MTTRNLTYLFKPSSVAVIGASPRPKSIGSLVMNNLLHGGFSGPIMPVNPKHTSVGGVLAYADVDSLPIVPALAVVCTPPKTIPAIIEQLCSRGTRAAAVLTAGLSKIEHENGLSVAEAVLATAKRYSMRILGHNCLGLLVPGIGLNASFAHTFALPGRIAFVSQSGALCTAVLDWAKPRGIGFSHFISMGDMLELDFGDVLDYLGSDPNTTAILLYIESIHQNRTFMSAARAASRNKPVLAIKSGRFEEGARAAMSHTGALTSNDFVYDAAFARAGMLRVYEFEELFAAVETLSRSRHPKGERLAILTNGGGLGVLAVDNLVERGGTLAKLSDTTIATLNDVLPETWSHANPVDIIGDAPGDRYAAALRALLDAKEVDAVLVMHCPVAVVHPVEIARTIVTLAEERPRSAITTCFVGDEFAALARSVMANANISCFDTPLKSVQAFMHTVNYRRNQKVLMETPRSLPTNFQPATSTAKLLVEGALANGRETMSEPEAKAVLAAYGIPIVETHVAISPANAAKMADIIGYPVVLKILSPDISHKSDVGGVVLGLESGMAVEQAGHAMLERVNGIYPEAEITGFSVQKMVRCPNAQELIIGVTSDPIFGPIILFGEGGVAVEVIKDHAVALPPLNMALARDLISRTKISKLLVGYRDHAPADIDAICLVLNQVAQLIIDIPEIEELDINPLFASDQGVLALDARIKIASTTVAGSCRLAIRAYPQELESTFTMNEDGTDVGRKILIRPIRPEDEPNHHIFISRLTPEDIRFRFFGLIKELPHSQMARLTQIDYDREMAFIATSNDEKQKQETLGVVRAITDTDNEEVEFSIVLRSDLKGTGLGRELLRKMIDYCRARGTQTMVGQVLRENHRMLRFVEALGFKIIGHVEPDLLEVQLQLTDFS
ncbi:MAG: GNAT family N-acetyltransferase [Gammaproteobacteria bacterium]|nr:GNAT family N-acetyltransferase [Gammaproteobacteria bacterium]NNJ84298.1 GNAT family N-acetyltransferase [Gammaproteobacteria bacterium]